MSLPSFGHLTKDRVIKVSEPIGRATFIDRGRHLILGQREKRGSLDSLILLGKCIEHTRTQDKYDANVWLDISFPHAIFLSGTRGSGKSFDIGVIVEGLALDPSTKICTKHNPVATVIFDLQNQFWTITRKPDPSLEEDKEHIKLLTDWELEPAQVTNARLFIPPGDPKIIGSEEELTISTCDLTADDLCSFWNTDIYSPQGHLIATILEKVAETGYDSLTNPQMNVTATHRVEAKANFEIEDLLRCVRTDRDITGNTNQQVIDAVGWRLESLRRTAIFRSAGIEVPDLLKEQQVVVLLLRSLDDATKALVSGILLRKFYAAMGDYHTKRKISRRLKKPLRAEERLPERVWCIIDEAHVVCPGGYETSATRSVIEYVKRGRDAGLSLVLATQQPSAIDTRVLSQVDLTLVHRLTFDGDIGAALARIPANLPDSFTFGSSEKNARILVRLLESGEAIIGDSQADRAFLGVVRPRLTAHGGAEPQ